MDSQGFKIVLSFEHDHKEIEIGVAIKDKNDLVEHLSTAPVTLNKVANSLFGTIEYTDMLIAINNVIEYTIKEIEKNKKEK